jgi:uncharacterized membrane protein YkvA (DUF1232 family)
VGTALDLVIAIAVAIVVLWLALVLLLLVLRPSGVDLAAVRRFVPDVLRLVRDLAKDTSLPRGVRTRLLLLLAYLVSPLDLVPDFIPVLGYADDVIVVAVVLRSVIRRAGPAALDRHWRGTPEGLRIIRRLAAAGAA